MQNDTFQSFILYYYWFITDALTYKQRFNVAGGDAAHFVIYILLGS